MAKVLMRPYFSVKLRVCNIAHYKAEYPQQIELNISYSHFSGVSVEYSSATLVNINHQFAPSGRKNVMSMRELFCLDPLAGFEKMAGFQVFYCLKIKCFHS